MADQADQFGGVPVKDEFGGVPVEGDEFGGVPAEVPPKKPATAEQKTVSIPMYDSSGRLLTPQGLDRPLSTWEKIATAPLRYEASSAEQFGRGVDEIRRSDQSADAAAQGLSDVARGGLGLATPFS